MFYRPLLDGASVDEPRASVEGVGRVLRGEWTDRSELLEQGRPVVHLAQVQEIRWVAPEPRQEMTDELVFVLDREQPVRPSFIPDRRRVPSSRVRGAERS